MKICFLLYCFICSVFNSIFYSVWEISSRWSCVQILHSVFTVNGEIISINKSDYRISSVLDFENLKIVNIFGDGGNFMEK